LFCIIDRKLSVLDRNGIIRIVTSLSDGCLCIVVSSRGEVMQTGADESSSAGEINGLAAGLGAEISEDGSEAMIKIPVVA
jgi:hypothetical protein